MNFNSIMIGTENPKKLGLFYTNLFGKATWEAGGYMGWRIGLASIMVGPHDAVAGENAEPGRLVWNIDSIDVKADFERLRDAGATVVQEPYQPSAEPMMWVAKFSDPDNNHFRLISPM